MPSIIKTTNPTTPPVTQSAVMEYLKVDDDSAEGGVILNLVNVGWALVEEYTGRALVPTTFRRYATGWPCHRVIYLRRAPLLTVESVKYYDKDGVQQTVSSSNYRVDTSSLPGRIFFKPEYEFPELDEDVLRPDRVTVDFTAGHNSDNEICNLAIKMFANEYYTNRNPVVTGTIATELPGSLQRLLLSQKVHSIFEL